MSQLTGHISQIIGPVIDVYFDTEGQEAEKVLPKIHDALKIDRGDGRDLIVEVAAHRRGYGALRSYGQYRRSASRTGGNPHGHTYRDACR